MFVLDSCICIDLMRGKLPYAYKLMSESNPALFKVPAVVAAELYFGAENSAHPTENYLLVERFLQPYEILPFNDACARAYAPIRYKLKEKGKPIGPNDLLIAATAIANQATLVSNNDREFVRIEGLRLENWYEIDL